MTANTHAQRGMGRRAGDDSRHSLVWLAGALIAAGVFWALTPLLLGDHPQALWGMLVFIGLLAYAGVGNTGVRRHWGYVPFAIALALVPVCQPFGHGHPWIIAALLVSLFAPITIAATDDDATRSGISAIVSLTSAALYGIAQVWHGVLAFLGAPVGVLGCLVAPLLLIAVDWFGEMPAQQGDRVKVSNRPLITTMTAAIGQAGASRPTPPTIGTTNELLRPVQPRRVIGREAQLIGLEKALLRHGKSSVALVGRAGVGKTSIVAGLAYAIEQGTVPPQLADRRVLEVDVAGILADDLESVSMLRSVLDEGRDPQTILFIDELHALMTLPILADVLKPAIASGEITIIGATTDNEYARIEKDDALARRFERVIVPEPDDAETLAIARGLTEELGASYRTADGAPLLFDDDALERAVALAREHLSQRIAQPAATIEVLHKAAVEAIYQGEHRVERNHVEQAVAELAGVSRELISGRGSRDLESALRRHVVGQDEALAVIARRLKGAEAGLADPRRPLLSLLATGPSGVGKTETGRALAAEVYGDSRRLIIVNMGEYAGQDGVNRLLGAAPGYIGYGERKPLDELRTHPASVVLFDEFDLAGSEVQNLLFRILDEGLVVDGQGRTIDFRKSIVIATTNKDRDTLLRQGVRLELLNRFDELVRYRHLSRNDQRQLLETLLRPVRERVAASRNLELELSDRALELLCERGYSREAGARAMRGVIDRLLLAGLEEQLTAGHIRSGDTVFVDAIDGELVFRTS